MKLFRCRKNHGVESQSKLRGIISMHRQDNSTNASYRQRVSLPSALRDCSTYNIVPHCFACGIIRLTNLTALRLSYLSLIKI